MQKIKVCKDCRFSVNDGYGLKCRHASVPSERYAHSELAYASWVREGGGKCGPDAKLFEPQIPPRLLPGFLWRNIGIIVFLLACLLGMAIVAHADKPLPVSKVTDATPYATAREAAEVALGYAVSESDEYEYGGVVIACPVNDTFWADFREALGRRQQNTAYYHTKPVTSDSRVRVEYQVAYPPMCKIVATYHTHPGNTTDSMMFSRGDIKQAKKLGVPSFVMVVRSRAVMVYEP